MTHARRFILIDPCLERIGSHPFHYAAEVLAAAAAEGFACGLATHRGFLAENAYPPEWNIFTSFEQTGYSKYTSFGELDRLDVRGNRRLRVVPPWAFWHAARRRVQRINAFARDAATLIQQLAPGDIVLAATATELDAVGLARGIASVRPPPGIGWHIQFHYPLYRGFLADYPRQDRRLVRVRRLLQEAVATAAPHAFHFYATTAELASQYERLGVAPFGVLPYPAQRPATLPSFDPRGVFDVHKPLRVTVLGDLRHEKNSHHLDGILAATARDPILADRITFAIQANATPLPACTHAANVELIRGPLDADAYARELSAADVMLLPYDQDRYRARCSGMLLEALAAGVVPIVTGGGWMGRQLAEPLRAHAEEVLARSRQRTLYQMSLNRIESAQPLSINVQLPSDLLVGNAGDSVALAIDITWQTTGRNSLHEAALRVAMEVGSTAPATVMAADPDGRPATVLCPIEPPHCMAANGSVRLTCAPVGGAAMALPRAIQIRCIRCSGPLPVGAVGVVIDSPADVVGALREVSRHAKHYRSTAIAHATCVLKASSAAEVVRSLLG